MLCRHGWPAAASATSLAGIASPIDEHDRRLNTKHFSASGCHRIPEARPLPFACGAGLQPYAAVDEQVHLYQFTPEQSSAQSLRFGNSSSAATFNLTAQTTNLARVTLTGIVDRVNSCQKLALLLLLPHVDACCRAPSTWLRRPGERVRRLPRG